MESINTRNDRNRLSKLRINRIKAQGYDDLSDDQIVRLATGNRFAYQLCTAIMIVGVLKTDAIILSGLCFIALLGVLLTNHPFDYIFNSFASVIHHPRVRPRSKQLKFACTIASLHLGVTAYLFYSGYTVTGTIMGIILIVVAGTVSITDYCLPSMIYNTMFAARKNNQHTERIQSH